MASMLVVKCFLLEQLCLPLAHTRPPTSKQLDYIGEIIDEFVFCEVDHKGAKRNKVLIIHVSQILKSKIVFSVRD